MASETELRDRAAIERTHLANERTLLAYIRTALAIVVGGLGMQLLEGLLADVLSFAVIVIGALIIPFGFWRFLRIKRRIG